MTALHSSLALLFSLSLSLSPSLSMYMYDVTHDRITLQLQRTKKRGVDRERDVPFKPQRGTKFCTRKKIFLLIAKET